MAAGPRSPACSFALLALLLPGSTLAQAPASPSLALASPGLDNLSLWQQHVEQPEGTAVDKASRGVFPVGDGHVFGYLGLGRRANTMQALSGPSYQTAEVWAPKGHYGESTLDLVEAGKAVPLPRQSLWRTRGANVVISEDAAPAASGQPSPLSLSTVTFALAPHQTIYRWVEVANRGQAARRLSLRASLERGKPAPSGMALASVYEAKAFEAELAASRPARAEGDALVVDLGELGPGQTATTILVLRTRRQGTEFAAKVPDEAAAKAALEACIAGWRQRLAGTATMESDNRRVTDLLEDWKVLMLVQRSEPSGAVSPMVNYRGSWVRDNNGPILAFLRYNLHREARAILDYVHDATVVTGRLNNHVPLDLDLSQAKEKARTADWSRIQIPGNELPAWIILQHEWYYRATWDIGFIKERWPFISACYRALRPSPRGTLPTHGDETYLHGSFFSLFPDRAGWDAFLPPDESDRRAASFESSAAYLVVINAMAELAEDVDRYEAGSGNAASNRKTEYEAHHLDYLQKLEPAFWLNEEKRFAPFVSPVNGAPYTAPYGPVNLLPQWIGYTYAIGEKNRENLRSTLEALWKKGVRIGMTPTCGYAVGHLQGLLLYALADLDDGRRHDVLSSLVDLAGPAGEWAELYDPDGRPTGAYSPEWPNRLRPWESGINIDAIFFALNGIRYVTCPGWSKRDQRYKLRTPPGATWMAMRDLRHDGHHFHIFLDEVYVRDLDKQPSGLPMRKMRFQIRFEHINKSSSGLEYVDGAINVGETLYVRYPTLQTPVLEQDAWPVDKESFLVPSDGPGKFTPRPLAMGTGKRLLITPRVGAGGGGSSQILDIGLPIQPEQLAELIVKGGQRVVDEVVFDLGARETSRATFKTAAFWTHPTLVAALADFEKLGGKLIEPKFLTSYSVVGPFPVAGVDDLDQALDPEKPENFAKGSFQAGGRQLGWTPASGAPDVDLGRALEASGRYVAYAAVTLESETSRECILKLGSDDGVKVFWNGRPVRTRKTVRPLKADQDEELLRLEKGRNTLLFKVYNDGGDCRLVARLTDLNGSPLTTVK